MNFYISDLHIGHKNVLAFDQRPFFTLKEMEETIIANWNSSVGKNDNVYILGDMFWNNDGAVDVLKQLKGNKFLILGNHDRINADMAKQFVWMKEYAEIKDNGTNLVLCHYPIAHWKNQSYGTIHLYGHIHQSRDSRPFELYKQMCENIGIPFPAYNVGCMMPYMNYTPRTLEEVTCGRICV